MRYHLPVVMMIGFSQCTVVPCMGQELSIGDVCPDLNITNYANNEAKSFRLTDIKTKLIILDFWGTGCTSCIKAFPKIDSLQKKFGNEIQFILVNKESPDSTRKFFSKRNKIRIPDVPMLMGDTLFHKLFPHLFIPHHVWLDSSKSVRYITDGYNATEKNIKDFLSGNEPVLTFKRDITEFEEPLIRKIPEWKKNVVYYSALSRCIPGLAIGNIVSSTADNVIPNRISCNCSSIAQLLQTAFSEGGKYNFSSLNTIIFNVRDDSKYTIPADEDKLADWYSHNSYYYELLIPPERSPGFYKIMQEDIKRMFAITVKTEKRFIKCLVLKRTSKNDKLRSKGGKPENRLWYADSIRYLKNRSFDEFVQWLKTGFTSDGSAAHFTNSTKYKGNVDITINMGEFMAKHDMGALRNQLKKYDLDLVEETCLADVLVIIEKKQE